MAFPVRASATLVLMLVAGGAAATDALPPLDAATDRVVARKVVPDDARRQGEVRLVTRGDATVVQSLLATKVLQRVVGEIRKKEERNWPDGGDSRRYVEQLTRVAEQLDGAEDERRHLLIEFIASSDAGGVVIGTFDGEEVDRRLRPTGGRAMATVSVGRDYLLRNMRLILADAFHLDESEVDRLGPLGPAAR